MGVPQRLNFAEFIAQLSDGVNLSMQFGFNFRQCVIGEIYVQEVYNICFTCEINTYSFNNPMNDTATCLQKPDEVQTSYGDVWIMKEGYWRNN